MTAAVYLIAALCLNGHCETHRIPAPGMLPCITGGHAELARQFPEWIIVGMTCALIGRDGMPVPRGVS